ncbi:MAG: acyltransferase 3 [Myxococcales bacterium]|nr:acyltransferase 3 [Myxococcales bacterium]
MSVAPESSEHLKADGRVAGLDALRVWCALWVVFGHLGFLPLTEGVDLTHLAGRISRLIYNNLTVGPAAVIVFFVISGFCIHYPFRRAKTIALSPFYARRYLRILIPVGAAILLSRPLGIQLRMFDKSVLWSLVCEEIYYAIYPLLLRLRLRFGWSRMIAVSYVASVILAMTNLPAGDYPSHGFQWNWVLGLPCWLLGCHLAESHVVGIKEPSRIRIGWWRLGALFLSMLARGMRFHTPITYPLTLNVFAFYVYFWLREEMKNAEGSTPGWAERAGVFSYSIYLIHPTAHEVWNRLALPSLGHGVDWILLMVFVLAASLIFYVFIERPSHRFARRAHRWLRNREALAQAR